jgi:hypothetical protein
VYGVYFQSGNDTDCPLFCSIAVPGDCPKKEALARESAFELAILIINWFD